MSYKYSIIIPTRNGAGYISACIETIVSQEYSDYELIISDDHSSDDTNEILSNYLLHPNITILTPDKELSMTEHWEWALSHASGTWQIFVGQDDGLQPYFFKLADKLTEIAEKKQIRTIMSSRAYYFWAGCEPVYGDVAVNYLAENRIEVHCSFYETFKALFGIQSYFDLPEMYTTSMFHKSILDEARRKQNGYALTCHPQDANLGAIAMSLDSKYLKSYIPLGWVGSSIRSAGLAITDKNKFSKEMSGGSLLELEKEYSEKIKKSKLKYNKLAGDFSFGEPSLYFWQAFLETPLLRSQKANDFLNSRFFKLLFFGALQNKFWLMKVDDIKYSDFKNILIANNCSFYLIKIFAVLLSPLLYAYRAKNIFSIVIRRIKRVLCSCSVVKVFIARSHYSDISLLSASELISKNISINKIINNVEKEYE